jgi:hypothetical protein
MNQSQLNNSSNPANTGLVTVPSNFDPESCRTKVKEWEKRVQDYSEIAKQKQKLYTIIWYVINVPIFVLLGCNAALPVVGTSNAFSFASSLVLLVLQGVSAQVNPSAKQIQYEAYYTTCQKMLQRMEFNSLLNLDSNQWQLLMNDLNNRMMTIIDQLPSDTQNPSPQGPARV